MRSSWKLALAVAAIVVALGVAVTMGIRRALPPAQPILAPPVIAPSGAASAPPLPRPPSVGAVPPPPPLASLPTETVDSVLQKLAAGIVAFNVPGHMRLARSQTLEARLGVNVPPETLVQEVTAEGQVKTAHLKVSPRMQATLSGGSAFEISPSGPQVQFVSNDESNIWQWQVTPKFEGRQMLVLTFDAILNIGG